MCTYICVHIYVHICTCMYTTVFRARVYIFLNPPGHTEGFGGNFNCDSRMIGSLGRDLQDVQMISVIGGRWGWGVYVPFSHVSGSRRCFSAPPR